MRYVTEDDLRARFGLGKGSELRLAGDERLTPSAASLVRDRGIRVLHVDKTGKVGVGREDGEVKRVSVLRTDTTPTFGKRCSQCGCSVAEKPEHLTHLDGETLVPKTHPRIVLRGKIDALIASLILAQTQFDQQKKLPRELTLWLADLRSWLGNILKAEVTGERVPEMGMGDMPFPVIRALSHYPEKYLGHDHIVPDATHGFDVALLNRLRAETREVELVVASLPDAGRPDMILAFNRLSSAIYVILLCAVVCGQGRVLPDSSSWNDVLAQAEGSAD